MKKIFLSLFVIVSFTGFSLYERYNQSSLSGNSSKINTEQTTSKATTQSSPSAISLPTEINLARNNDEDNSGDDEGYEVIPTTPKPTTITTPKPTPIATIPAPIPTPTTIQTGQYKNGTYVGDSVNVYYGDVQVKAIISGGKLTDVIFLNYPQDRAESLKKSNKAMPILKQEAISAQSAQVDAVSGASATSDGFVQSLGSALTQAKV